ncbi:MAG: Mur ligase domain-containing protein [Saprospiraceae bacterium]
MKIHLIAIGGAIMHNLAMELHDNGHIVTGSDDAIYDPALSRLAEKGILPTEFGWHPERVTNELDLVILGMHARIDNPELLKAQEIGVKLMSFPEFMYDHAKDKKRVVIAGSHGKTTTTSMVLHLLKSAGREVDFLVGAQLEGFGNMVKLSDAPIAVFE